jgi:Pro-kumamolisin, activation domain/IPT/TIG domain
MLALLAFAMVPSGAQGRSDVRVLDRDLVTPVAHGQALSRGAVAAGAVLNINIGLAVRNSTELEALIQTASTPGDPGYGHYLTQRQYAARFAPTNREAIAVERWLQRSGLHITGRSSDNLLVHASGISSSIDRAFHIRLENYALAGRDFYAAAQAPQTPLGLHVNWVGGLSDYEHAQAANTCLGSVCGYTGGDFRIAYDLSGNGEGQSLGFTLWGEPVPQDSYTKYAKASKTKALAVGGTGANGLDFVQVGGASSEDEEAEVALDTENAQTVAPGIHENYWLGHDNSVATLESVLNEAANSNIAVISNSWYLLGGCSSNAGMETSLQHGVATGKTFYFATADFGAREGCTFPSVSPYAVAVGGTDLEVAADSTWKSESAFDNDGGCSNGVPRPTWQIGIGTPKEWASVNCTGRATPDVSADSCYSSEGSGIGCWSFIYFDGGAGEYGGTSLATPIWAAATTLWNKANIAAGRPTVGFAAPLIYSLANDPNTYARDFRDIQSGSNGFAATAGWDEATGWGTPDFNNLFANAADLAYTGPTSAAAGQSVTLSADLYDHGTTHGLAGRTIHLAAASESCQAVTSEKGLASCSVQIKEKAGHYTATAAFAGDGGYSAASANANFTVGGGEAPTVTKLSPNKGPAGGGTTVTITGTGFVGTPQVKFGVAQGTNVKVVSATSLTVLAPANGAGTVDVTVSTANGISAITTKDRFKYAKPTVTGLSPSTGGAAGGTAVTVTGTGFVAGADSTIFMFGKAAGTAVSCASSLKCTVTAPAGRVGTVDVIAKVGKLKSAKTSTDRYGYS